MKRNSKTKLIAELRERVRDSDYLRRNGMMCICEYERIKRSVRKRIAELRKEIQNAKSNVKL